MCFDRHPDKPSHFNHQARWWRVNHSCLYWNHRISCRQWINQKLHWFQSQMWNHSNYIPYKKSHMMQLPAWSILLDLSQHIKQWHAINLTKATVAFSHNRWKQWHVCFITWLIDFRDFVTRLIDPPVSEQEKSLFRKVDGPVVNHRVDFCQVFRLPVGHTAQQQVKEGASFVTQVVFAPQESLLVFCQTGSGENTLSSFLQHNSNLWKRLLLLTSRGNASLISAAFSFELRCKAQRTRSTLAEPRVSDKPTRTDLEIQA